MEQRNTLATSTSPYLRQHQDNPIHWQEYSSEVMEYAQENDLPVLISIGYATCHWCHVMAADAFSNTEIAEYMNNNFICIKIDREQRPDIDAFCMNFIQQHYGQGGWPLNVVVTPDFRPFFAATYIASTQKYNMPSFLDVMKQVKEFYESHKDSMDEYEGSLPSLASQQNIDRSDYIRAMDHDHGGFLGHQKFPPHCTLHYLMSDPGLHTDDHLRTFAHSTLTTMANSGLHDHVGGGFFRYCVDENWHIPHFEKMLYDQAMMLINYSLGYVRYHDENFRTTVEMIMECLYNTFTRGNLYVSGHDADTHHEEGATYLWTQEELIEILNDECDAFLEEYGLVAYEGRLHIIRYDSSSTRATDLYEARKKREQPTVDTKIVTSINALLGIAFCHVEKYTGITTPIDDLYKSLNEQRYHHSSHNGITQDEYFLEDAAAMLLLDTYMYERGKISYDQLVVSYNDMNSFQVAGAWIENSTSDFRSITAGEFDHPIPSSRSLVHWAQVRYALITDTEVPTLDFKPPLHCDTYNFASMFASQSYIIKSTEHPAHMPILSLYLSSTDETLCHNFSCVPYRKEDLDNLI